MSPPFPMAISSSYSPSSRKCKTSVMDGRFVVLCVAKSECLKAISGHVYSAQDQARALTFIENLSGSKGAQLDLR